MTNMKMNDAFLLPDCKRPQVWISTRRHLRNHAVTSTAPPKGESRDFALAELLLSVAPETAALEV
jgi:hypothetical protein